MREVFRKVLWHHPPRVRQNETQDIDVNQGATVNTILLPRQRELALAIAVTVGLTACGGGSTGVRGSNNIPAVGSNNLSNVPSRNIPGNPSGQAVATPPVDVQITATNTAAAHTAGFTGKGVKIAIVDSGVSSSNPALAGRVTDKLNYVDPTANNLNIDDVLGHGSVVAQMAAGQPFGTFAGGIAPDASLVSVRIIADKEPKDDGSGQGNKVTGADAKPFGNIFDATVATGAHIINNSWGGLYWDAADQDTTDSFDDAFLQAASGNALFVFAAGNSGAANPSDLAALPTRAGNLEKGWLAVVALDSNHTDQIASYSNRCGVAKNYCLAAPGTVIALSADSTAANPKYVIGEGTSFAAPQVSGAAALISAQGYTNLDGIRQVLLGTADDLGTPGPDDVFGYGRLNVGRAVLGPAKLDWGTLSTYFSSDFTFANDISGTGGLSLTGGNVTLTLAGNNTYTGITSVSSSLTVNALHGIPGELSINGPATVNVTGDIGGKVTNSGNLVTGDTSTHVTGDFTQLATGSLSQKLGAPLVVSGTANLAGNYNIAGAVTGYTVTSHQSLLTAGSVVGQFNSLTRSQGVFLSSTLQYLPTEVWIDTTQLSISQVAATSMPQSAAAQSSAQRLDGAFTQINTRLAASATGREDTGIDTSTLIAAGAIQQAPNTASARASLESLSGQLYAANTAVTLAGIEAGNDALMQHLDQETGTGAWTRSLGSQGGLSRGGFGNVDFNLGGNMVGHDLRLGASGFAGIAVSQMRSSGQLSGSMDRQSSRSTEGMLYAGSRAEHWYGVGRFGFGSFRGNTQRLLRLGEEAAFAGGDNTGHYNAAYGEIGYRTDAGAFSLTPFANVEYASIRRDGFQETGGDGFGLAADGHTTSRWQAGFGLRAGSSWLTSYGKLRLDAKLGWQNAFATKGEVFSARYNGIAQWAPVDGIGLSRRAGTAGMQLALDMSEHTQLGFNVDQRFADRDHSRSASASFRMNW